VVRDLTDADIRKLESATTMLESLKLSPEEVRYFLDHGPAHPDCPTVADWVLTARTTVTEGTLRAYGTYWDRIAAAHGDKPLSKVTVSDLKAMALEAPSLAVKRRNSNGGNGAHESFVAAARCLFQLACDQELLRTNPALAVPKPSRVANNRRALLPHELAELSQICRATGKDPALDALIERFVLETGARREGVLNLELGPLDPARCLVVLDEKNNQRRQQPVSQTLTAALLDHAHSRGASAPADKVFRYRPAPGETVGAPLTHRRIDSLHARWAEHLDWARRDNVSLHWLRHTAITAVERIDGYAVAKTFAGHKDKGGKDGTTLLYSKASQEEVCAAHSRMTGEEHPLAPGALDGFVQPQVPPGWESQAANEDG
jgi:integrase